MAINEPLNRWSKNNTLLVTRETNAHKNKKKKITPALVKPIQPVDVTMVKLPARPITIKK